MYDSVLSSNQNGISLNHKKWLASTKHTCKRDLHGKPQNIP